MRGLFEPQMYAALASSQRPVGAERDEQDASAHGGLSASNATMRRA